VVPGTGGVYVTSRIDLSGNAAVGDALNFANSTGNFSLGFINGGTDDGTRYGFFSDFKSSNVESSSVETCPSSPVQLTAYGGVSYKWTPAAGLSNPNIASPTASPVSTTDYTVEITTADGCVDFATVHVTVSGGITPSVSIAASANDICPGRLVTFTATPVNGGATPVYQWQVNGVNVGTNSLNFSSTTLANGDKVSCNMISSAPCANPASVSSNTVTMNVASSEPPTISIIASENNICPGIFVHFTSTVANAGSDPIYQWQVNGVNAGNSNSPTYGSGELANGDKVTCMVTTTSACDSYTVTSDPIIMVVNDNLPASVNITVSKNNVCIGTNVTFTATAINGGSAPNYRWVVNGVYYGDDSPTFSTVLTDKDRVTCMMWSNATCAAPVPAISNAIIMEVNPDLTPQVSISASTNNICPGDAIIFTATAVDAGTNPAYQWKLNGNDAGTNSATFAGTAFVNGDVVSCIVTSNAVCPTTPTGTSNSIGVIVNTPVSPSVSITASGNNICSGTSVTFTATPINGGSAPIYQWQVNGVNAGTNSNTFSSNTLANNDVVSCQLTSNAKCAVPVAVPSNTLTIAVNPVLPASVSIVASQNNVCTGTYVTFTATSVNGGSSPAYQWAVNGVNAGNNGAIFSSSTFANGDRVTCIMTSNALCASPAATGSNAVVMIINPYITPSVSISASTNNICPGEMITFTATAVNGGTAPAYQWLLNGNNAGSNNATFAGNTFIAGDIVKCIITSNATCTTTSTATSSDIRITVNPPVSPSVTIAASNNNICYGTAITFTATPINGGNAPAYQWLINGVSTGTNKNTFVSSTLANNDAVSCRLTSNAKCAVPAIVNSNNTITMVISPIPVVNGGGDKTIEKGNSVILSANASGTIANVTWSPSAGLDNTTTLTPTANPEKTTLYTLTVQSTAGCTNTATVKVTVLTHLIIPNTFTPNGDGINDKWEIGNLADYPDAYVKIFNRWGAEVYRSKGGSGAWDGTIKGKRLPFGTYYYVINLDKKAPPISGYVALIR
jgi:gliding motility-associated-like protein